jgi:prephenate dehydratase
VVHAVVGGKADLGMLPIENSCVGPIPGVAELLAGSEAQILRRVDLPVRMHLLAVAGARLREIQVVASHPVALAQCSKTLRDLGVGLEEASNTAVAAKELAGSASYDRAVLASERAAEVHGLVILKRDMQDSANNRTTFAVIAARN